MGQSAITYDDANLQRLFAEMDVKQRLQALKGAFRREANQVRKTALNNLRGSIRTDKDMESGVRTAGKITDFTKIGKALKSLYLSGRKRELKTARLKPKHVFLRVPEKDTLRDG